MPVCPVTPADCSSHRAFGGSAAGRRKDPVGAVAPALPAGAPPISLPLASHTPLPPHAPQAPRPAAAARRATLPRRRCCSSAPISTASWWPTCWGWGPPSSPTGTPTRVSAGLGLGGAGGRWGALEGCTGHPGPIVCMHIGVRAPWLLPNEPSVQYAAQVCLCAGQPALIYLVPATLGAVALVAASRCVGGGAGTHCHGCTAGTSSQVCRAGVGRLQGERCSYRPLCGLAAGGRWGRCGLSATPRRAAARRKRSWSSAQHVGWGMPSCASGPLVYLSLL